MATMTTKLATVKIINELQCAIIGLRPEEYMVLYEQFGYYAKGYAFAPLFKLRKWDGKVRFFSKGGLTYIHLLSEILPQIERMGYKLKLIDKRTAYDFKIPKIDKDYFADFGITLGDHQVEAVNTVAEMGNGIVLAGTGAGKTYMTAAICDLATKYNGSKNMVIVPTTDLVQQTRTDLQQFGLAVGQYSGNEKDLSGDTVVSTWQSLQYNPGILGQFNSIIVDECHGVTGKVLRDLLENHAGHCAFRLALTGTLQPDPADAMTMRVLLGEVLYTVPAYQLIESGWLAKLKIKMQCLKETLKKEFALYMATPGTDKKMTEKEFAKTYMPDYDSEKEFLWKKKIRNEYIADLIYNLSQRPKGNTFVLVQSVAHGKYLSSLIDGSVFIYGADKVKVRKKIYDAYATNDNLVVISTYKLASTGLNIKRMFHLVMIDANKSFTQVIQTIGRSLRKAEDKDSVEVYDLHSNMKFSRKHAAQRKTYYESQRYEVESRTVDYTVLYEDID